MSSEQSGSKFARIRSKIPLIMGSLFFLLAIVIGLLFYFLVLPQGLSGKKPSAQNALLAEQMKTSLQEAQNNATRLLMDPDAASIEKNKDAVTQLLSLSWQFAQNAQKSGDNKAAATANQINSAAKQFGNTFNEVVEARQTKGVIGSSGLLSQLDNAGKQLTVIFSRNEAGSLALALLRIQRHEEDYLRTINPLEQKNLRTAIKQFSRLLLDTNIDPVEAQMLRKGIREYSSALDRYQAVSLATTDQTLSNTLDKEQQRQAEAMRIASDNLQVVINRVNVPEALHQVLSLRHDVSAYLLTGDQKYVQQVNDALDRLAKTYSNSSILQEHKDQAIKGATIYKKIFTSVVQQDALIKDRVAKLNGARDSLESLINKAISTTAKAKSRSAIAPGIDNVQAMIIVGVGLAIALVGLVAAIILGRSISAPIESITRIIRRISTDKDFSVEIPVSTKGEIGELANELNILLDVQESTFAEDQEDSSTFSEDTQELSDAVHTLQTRLTKISDTNGSMRETVTSQTQLLDTLISSITQIAAAADTLTSLHDKSRDQHEVLSTSKETIENSVESAVNDIQSITQSTSQLTDIINVSNEIAEQTSLLALNASVKAARAGSHGKEFAVIADEIAKLAQRSEEIAKEAGQLTGDLTGTIDNASSLGSETRQSLEQLLGAIQQDQEASEELSEHIASIKTNSEEVEKLASTFHSSVQEIDSFISEQGSDCTVALEQVEEFLDNEPADTETFDAKPESEDEEVQQEVDDSAISSSEQIETDKDTADRHVDDTAASPGLKFVWDDDTDDTTEEETASAEDGGETEEKEEGAIQGSDIPEEGEENEEKPVQ